MARFAFAALFYPVLVACNGVADDAGAQAPDFAVEEIADFDEPWAMAFLPDGRFLVTEKAGTMRIGDLSDDALRIGSVRGIPTVEYGGQGGLGDVVPHPGFAENGLVYFSYVEAGEDDTRGAVVARGRLDCGEPTACVLADVETIWRQWPKVTGRGHYSHRIAFGPGDYLWITSGDRQKMEPAQDLSNNLGTVVRLNDDGSVPEGNPFADRGGVSAQIWSYGHRNLLGLAFSPDGRLWDIEHGPRGGDEINLIERGANYGWPLVSDGDHYDGMPIPDHDTTSDYHPPAISWNPVIGPGNLIFYTGAMFPEWNGYAIASGMVSQGLVFVAIDEGSAREAARYPMGARIRSVVQGPDGALWVIEDERDGSQGRLLRLTPAG